MDGEQATLLYRSDVAAPVAQKWREACTGSVSPKSHIHRTRHGLDCSGDGSEVRMARTSSIRDFTHLCVVSECIP